MKRNIILVLTVCLLSFGSLFAYEVDGRIFTSVEICDEERELDRTSDNNEDTKFLFSFSSESLEKQIAFGVEALIYKTPSYFLLLKPPRDSPLFS